MPTKPRQSAPIPGPRIADRGFRGAIARHASDASPPATARIAETTGADLEAVCAFLDGRYGHHFADAVLLQLSGRKAMDAALNAAIDQWLARPSAATPAARPASGGTCRPSMAF